MVRFSDIIKVKDKTGSKGSKGEPPQESIKAAPVAPPEPPPREDRIYLSDSQAIKESDAYKTSAEGFISEASTPAQSHLEIVTYYQKFLERAKEIRSRIKGDQGISPSPILSDLHYIIDNQLINDLYEYAMSTPDNDDNMLAHTVEVAFASLKVGMGMDYDTKELLKLGLAAFLENVGMYKVPERILTKKGKLERNELVHIRKHPEVSAELLSRMGKRYAWLAEVALQTHERADGSGYPRGLAGEEISELASIIGLVDTYVAMIKNRPYRDKLIQTDAIKFIVGKAKGLFPQKVLKVFLNQISLFPVNTHVMLNNKSIGRVISTDKSQPLRPTIEILYDGQGKKSATRKVVRLTDNPLLYITNSINEKELPA